MRGTIVSLNERSQLAEIKPAHDSALGNISVETALLVKYIRPGAHVKVINGVHLGQTGTVVNVHRKDGDHIAVILVDGINTEISCNVGYLQVSGVALSVMGYCAFLKHSETLNSLTSMDGAWSLCCAT